MAKFKGCCLGLAFATLLVSPASATVLFFDTFNRATGGPVGNGWTEIESAADDVTIGPASFDAGAGNNSARMRDQSGGAVDAAIEQLTLSTLGYSNIQLSFAWSALDNSDLNDTLYADWRIAPAGTPWTTTAGTILFQHTLEDNSNNFFFVDPITLIGADNQANIQIRFRTDTNANTEGARIDVVQLTAVPEPATLTVVGVGLLGLGAMRRRKKAVHA